MTNPETIRLAAAVSFAAALAAGLIGIVPAAAAPASLYTAVMDAGSTGTRIVLYEVVPGPYPVRV